MARLLSVCLRSSTFTVWGQSKVFVDIGFVELRELRM